MGKANIRLSIIITLIVVASLSVTYAYMELNATNTTATGEGGCFEVAYVGGQDINNLSLQSTTSYENGAYTTVTLSKDESCKIYTEASIYLSTDGTNTTAPLSTGALKYKIMQGSNEVAGGSGAITQSGDTLLKTVELTDTPTTYTIYFWIDSSISSGQFNQKTYSGYIYAVSTQSSTITG